MSPKFRGSDPAPMHLAVKLAERRLVHRGACANLSTGGTTSDTLCSETPPFDDIGY